MSNKPFFDFSHLPETVWTAILKQLPLEDRYHVSQTCHALMEYFRHPSVWHTVVIKFTAELDNFTGGLRRQPQEIMLTSRYKHMIHHFGCYFQNLSVTFFGVITGLTEEHKKVIEALAKHCRLESLTLDIGTAPSTLNTQDLSMPAEDLQSIAMTVTNAFRLRVFNLKSWPSFQKVNILLNLMDNNRVKNLESINILHKSANETTWTTVNAPIPEAENIVQIVRHFENLSTLSLRSDLLTEDVVEEIARTGRLRRLDVVVIYSSRTKRGLHEITSQTWTKASKRCPELKVFINFANRIPFVDKNNYMKSEIPVSAVSFMKYSECCPEDIHGIADKYHKTLAKFINYSDSGDFDEQLVAMVSHCSNLVHLASCGPIMRHTVLQLAGMRGERWKCFQMKEDKIKFQALRVGYSQDAVLAQSSSGKLVMAQVDRSLSDNLADRRKDIQELDYSVCEILQRKWSLLPPNFLDEVIEHRPGT